MEIGIRFLFILSGILLGVLAKQYFVGVYSIIFQSLVWTVLIALTIHNVKNKYNSSSWLGESESESEIKNENEKDKSK